MRPPYKKASKRLKRQPATTVYSPDENPFDVLRKSLFRWLNTKVGLWGGALLVAGFMLWVGWDSVSKLPGFDMVMTEWQEWRGLPHAKGDRFSIVIAQLDNDPKGEHRGLIDDALRGRFTDQIEILLESPRVQ